MLPAGYMPYEWGKGAAKVQLLLPESTSVLKYTQSDFVAEAEGDAAGTVGALTLRDSRWWGRLYVDGWPKALQYYRAHFGAPPPMGQMRVLVADPPTGCGNPYNFEHRNADGTAAAEDGEVEVGAAGGPETKEPNPEAEPEEPTGAFNTFDDYLKALPREFQGAPLDNAAVRRFCARPSPHRAPLTLPLPSPGHRRPHHRRRHARRVHVRRQGPLGDAVRGGRFGDRLRGRRQRPPPCARRGRLGL